MTNNPGITAAKKALKKKFSKVFRPGTRVMLAGTPRYHEIIEISRDRTTVKLEGLTGVFQRAHVVSYTNKPIAQKTTPE